MMMLPDYCAGQSEGGSSLKLTLPSDQPASLSGRGIVQTVCIILLETLGHFPHWPQWWRQSSQFLIIWEALSEFKFLFRVLAVLPSIVCCGMMMMKWQKMKLKKLHTTYVICSHVAHGVCPIQHLHIMHILLLSGLVCTWTGKCKTVAKTTEKYKHMQWEVGYS